MQAKHLILFLAAAVVALPSASLASGTYSARPPKPPVNKSDHGAKMDSAKYEQGKRIYNGKTKLAVAPSGAAAVQEPRLRTLEARLPEREKKSTKLSSLAGRLSAEQLDALEYYIAQRFGTK